VGLILDLAVAALALTVVGSLALLAWTFAVNGVRATRRARRQVAGLRAELAQSEARLHALADQAKSTLDRYASRAAGDRTDR
jgi:cell division protein FtsB